MFGLSRFPTRQQADRVIYRKSVHKRKRVVSGNRFYLSRRIFITLLRCSLISATLIGAFVGAQHLENSPYFNVSQVSVLGTYLLERDTVVQEAAIVEGTNTFQVNLDMIRLRVLENPYVKGAIIRRELPGTIVIEVIERKPLAQLSLNDVNFLVSDDGVVLEELTENEGFNFPVIVNASPTVVKPGDQLQQHEFRAALAILHVLRDMFPELHSRLQTIEIQGGQKGVLRFRGLTGVVCIGTTMIETSLEQFVALMPKLSNMTFTTVDFRFQKKAVITF